METNKMSQIIYKHIEVKPETHATVKDEAEKRGMLIRFFADIVVRKGLEVITNE